MIQLRFPGGFFIQRGHNPTPTGGGVKAASGGGRGGESGDVIGVIWWVHTLETAACLFFRYLTCSLKLSWHGSENWVENIRDIDKGSKCGQLFANKATWSKRHRINDANKLLTVRRTRQAGVSGPKKLRSSRRAGGEGKKKSLNLL